MIPAFAPSDKLFVSKYKMSGPGANVKSIDAVKKYMNVEFSNSATSKASISRLDKGNAGS